jgi:DNA-directed RNA polymerase specialized sigma24 family protein
MTLEDPDLALVQALQAGEDLALDTLMARHQEGLYRLVFRHISNEADAMELTQEAFARAYFNIENQTRQFTGTKKFFEGFAH